MKKFIYFSILTKAMLFFSSDALAYPNFIGYGYTSCLTCHYNPYGNGPLTDYGRALGATSISDNAFRGDTELDEIGQRSGFFYSKPSSSWFRPSFDYRGLFLRRDLDNNNSEDEIIHMDANFNIVLRLGPAQDKDKFIISASMGYAPIPRGGQFENEAKYRSREHYLGYRISPSWGVYAGLMDKVYGIRVVDHIAYSRAVTSNTMNDQTHSLLIHYTNPSIDIGIQPFVGNLGEDARVRQQGFAANVEYTWSAKVRPGLSYQASESEFLKTYAAAIHGRLGFGKGNSIIAEMGQVTDQQIKRDSETTTRYWMVQTHLLASKGFFFLNTIEYLKTDVEQEDKTLRWGPGIQYFMTQGLELRMDLYNTRVFSSTSVSNDIWDLTAQVHLWF